VLQAAHSAPAQVVSDLRRSAKMNIPFSHLLAVLTLGLSGCVQSRSFSGLTSIQKEGYHARIDSAHVAIGTDPKYNFGSPNGNMPATGMAFQYSNETKESPKFSDFKARYKKDGITDDLKVRVYEVTGYRNNMIRAYLIPEKFIGKPTGYVKHQEMDRGKYDVRVEFLDDGVPKVLDFSFGYHFSISPYIGPIKTWED
jgi:hypothetical protein